MNIESFILNMIDSYIFHYLLIIAILLLIPYLLHRLYLLAEEKARKNSLYYLMSELDENDEK